MEIIYKPRRVTWAPDMPHWRGACWETDWRGSSCLEAERTVRVINPNGRGGRNLEYLLGLAIALDGAPNIYAIACDTDRIDGTEDNAGGIIVPDTLARAGELGLDPRAALAQNQTYEFFEALGDLVITGPTRTNVNDLRAIIIEARP